MEIHELRARPQHERLLLQMKENEFNLWLHNPITAAYMFYLADLASSFRQAVLDIWEQGRLGQPGNPQTSGELIRGRVLTLTELQALKLGDIQEFYRQPDTQVDDGAEVNQGPAR